MIASARDAETAVLLWLGENGGSFRYAVVSSRQVSTNWVVVLDVFTNEGHLIDGPCVSLVDSTTGAVSTRYP